MKKSNFIMFKIQYSKENNIDLWRTLVLKEGFRATVVAFKSLQDFKMFKASTNSQEIILQYEIDDMNKNKITDFLSKFRERFDLVSLIPKTRLTLSFAIRDNRIDSIIVDGKGNNLKLFTQKHLKNISQHEKLLEIDLGLIFYTFGIPRTKILNKLKQIADFILKYDIKTILSLTPISKIDIRKPQEVISISNLFNLSRDIATKSISDYPNEQIRKNIEKRSSNYVMEGVYIMREGKG